VSVTRSASVSPVTVGDAERSHDADYFSANQAKKLL
jgi:hypothetical protein